MNKKNQSERDMYDKYIRPAFVEVKEYNHALDVRMAQAINCARLLDVPFSVSSNGDGFVFRDATMATGVLEQTISLEVARVESLRHLCTDLRQRLAARQTAQSHLAEALIDEVA